MDAELFTLLINNMTTKVTVFKKGELKKIEFVKVLDNHGVVHDTKSPPCEFDNVELIRPKYDGEKYDIFDAWDDDFDAKLTFLGHFNDGIV